MLNVSAKNISSSHPVGPAWPSGKVFDLYSRGPGLEPHLILWVFSWECPWARHFRAQPSTGETQEEMNNVSCCCDLTDVTDDHSFKHGCFPI